MHIHCDCDVDIRCNSWSLEQPSTVSDKKYQVILLYFVFPHIMRCSNSNNRHRASQQIYWYTRIASEQINWDRKSSWHSATHRANEIRSAFYRIAQSVPYTEFRQVWSCEELIVVELLPKRYCVQQGKGFRDCFIFSSLLRIFMVNSIFVLFCAHTALAVFVRYHLFTQSLSV